MNLTLTEKLDRRNRVLIYLKAMKLSAVDTLGLDNLNDDQWDLASKNYMDACFNLRTARMGNNWMKHFNDAQTNGF